ncbi:DUF3307 domain-containing protein [Pseudoroseicyclus tamaricis]|uniref:DUF3307 domain-containing protein n=1 Tax=Pseudoroseicyclus tamaricis TaxID=2705421 RepID=A0A6B2JGS7_9RHOB|nr:DUF3307 domain-containing protein [Pseudoroseicyclus tamaricis]NDV00411.1 DUF3307 domain-containing protein [Pseudoroseicyclus tamaricis]
MIESFALLLAAHALGDFLLQSDAMAARKAEGRPGALLAHAGIHLALLLALLAPTEPRAALALLALALAHLAIDAGKALLPRRGLTAFLVDQALHLASLALLAQLMPGLWEASLWAPYLAEAPRLLALGAGFLIAARAGSFAVALLMEGLAPGGLPAGEESGSGLPRGGAAIGYLERGLIFVLMLAGQPGSIGFLIAAKSILRFGTVSESRAASEYVIIGTLASFGWAIAVTFAAQALAARL